MCVSCGDGGDGRNEKRSLPTSSSSPSSYSYSYLTAGEVPSITASAKVINSLSTPQHDLFDISRIIQVRVPPHRRPHHPLPEKVVSDENSKRGKAGDEGELYSGDGLGGVGEVGVVETELTDHDLRTILEKYQLVRDRADVEGLELREQHCHHEVEDGAN